MTTASDLPARAIPTAAGQPTADQQRGRIVDLALSGLWNGTSSAAKLAAEWGIGVRTVQSRAVEAFHAVRIATDPDRVAHITRKLAELEGIQATAMSEVKVVCTGKDDDGVRLYETIPQPNTRVAKDCVELYMKALGAFVQRIEVGQPGEFSTVSTAELIAQVLKAQPELGELVAGLLGGGTVEGRGEAVETVGEAVAEPSAVSAAPRKANGGE